MTFSPQSTEMKVSVHKRHCDIMSVKYYGGYNGVKISKMHCVSIKASGGTTEGSGALKALYSQKISRAKNILSYVQCSRTYQGCVPNHMLHTECVVARETLHIGQNFYFICF